MKYIRTKSGQLFTVAEKIDKTEFNHSFKYLYRIKEIEKIDNGSNIIVDVNVVKEADTIEELSDAYVIVPKDKKFKPYTLDTLSGFDDIEAVLEHNDIYSSIWVNALLKPVAKMNEIGDLCLI